jgi:hypothetical protein
MEGVIESLFRKKAENFRLFDCQYDDLAWGPGQLGKVIHPAVGLGAG